MSKMNQFITILFVCFCNSIAAQSLSEGDSIEKPIVNKQFRFQIAYFQDVNYYPVYTDHGMFGANQDINPKKIININSVAIGCNKTLRKHISIDLNCELSSKQVYTNPIYLQQNQNLLTQQSLTGYVYSIQHLNIPIGLNYYVGNKFKIGIHNSFAFKFKIASLLSYYTIYPSGNSRGNSILLNGKKDVLNIDYRIGLFVSYKFKHMSIKLMPIYRVDLLNTYKGFKYTHANSYGLGIVIII